jgi:hypothetical protein
MEDVMSDNAYFERRTEETVAEYAARMRHFVRVLAGTVSIEAGLTFDADDVIASLDAVISWPDDDSRAERWELVQSIHRHVDRILDIDALRRIDGMAMMAERASRADMDAVLQILGGDKS